MSPANDTTVFGLEQFTFEKKTRGGVIITKTQKMEGISLQISFQAQKG
jgi:hypothetical protein